MIVIVKSEVLLVVKILDVWIMTVVEVIEVVLTNISCDGDVVVLVN